MTAAELNPQSEIVNRKSEEVVVSARGLTKVFKDFWNRPKRRGWTTWILKSGARRGLRPARPERLRQIHDDRSNCWRHPTARRRRSRRRPSILAASGPRPDCRWPGTTPGRVSRQGRSPPAPAAGAHPAAADRARSGRRRTAHRPRLRAGGPVLERGAAGRGSSRGPEHRNHYRQRPRQVLPSHDLPNRCVIWCSPRPSRLHYMACRQARRPGGRWPRCYRSRHGKAIVRLTNLGDPANVDGCYWHGGLDVERRFKHARVAAGSPDGEA